MAGNKFLTYNNGNIKETSAADASAGAGDAGKLIALNSSGKVDLTMLPTGVGPDVKTIVAFEDLDAGDWVNVFDNAGTVNVRKADATGPGPGKKTDGFVLTTILATNPIDVYFEGVNDQLTGLTPGAMHYTSTTAGAATETPPSGTGNIVQQVGRAVSSTEISFEATQTIELA